MQILSPSLVPYLVRSQHHWLIEKKSKIIEAKA